ncbi:MAG: glycine/sarcosine/betaine reductase component B subunit [[Clostridium] symbiosum]
MNRMVPTVMHPNEILRALVSGSFMPVSSKWSTYDFPELSEYQGPLQRAWKDHQFLGVIMSNLNVALEQKERAALFVAQIANTLERMALLWRRRMETRMLIL